MRPERQVGPRPLEQWKPGATDSPLTEMTMIIIIMMQYEDDDGDASMQGLMQ